MKNYHPRILNVWDSLHEFVNSEYVKCITRQIKQISFGFPLTEIIMMVE